MSIIRRAFSLEIALNASFLVCLPEWVQSHQIFCITPLMCHSGSLCRSSWCCNTFRVQSYRECILHICIWSSSRRNAINGSLWMSPLVSHDSRLGLLLLPKGTRRTLLRASALVLSKLPCLLSVPGIAGSCLAGFCTLVHCRVECTPCRLFCWRPLEIVFWECL